MWAIGSASVTVMLLAFALATIGFGLAAAQYQLESAIHESVPCGDEAMERKIQEIMHVALDNALRGHIERTFDVMMRNYAGGVDEAQTRQSAGRGVRGGVNAYIQAEKSLANWKLMRC